MTDDVVVVDTMGGLGDLLLALPLIEALGRSHPEARLTVVTTAPWHVLLERDPRIHAVVPVPGRDGAAVTGAVRPVLERLRPDLAVTTNRQHGLPELLAAHARRAVTDLWRRPPADEPVDLRMLRLLVEEGVVDPALATLPPKVVLGEDEVAAGRRVLDSLGARAPVLVMPDSGMAVKHWPLASWADVVRGLAARGRTPVVVSEVAEQRRVLAEAAAAAAPALPIRGVAGLAAAAAGLGGAAAGGDTGPVRLAAAAGLPVVGLFGPTLAARYGYRGAAVNLQGLPGCPVRRPTAITEQECWWEARCPLTADHAPACMADIAPAGVLAALLAAA
ncbi:glycosyltransferase family 9 protein [Amnibacterium endophyticum]|uniref:Glycosyltransferase family 9 protein n=1 Tax=Amnibacterium endophyticum TaxID=2109337 RepID=A0ABW4LDA3_9MICO